MEWSNYTKIIIIFAFLQFIVSCGKGYKARRSTSADTLTATEDYNINVVFNNGSSLALAETAGTINDWTIVVTACASGFTQSFSQLVDGSLKLPSGVSGCYARLTSVTINTVVYNLTDTGANDNDATDWAIASIRNYKDAAETLRKLKVTVVNTITLAGVSNTDELSFSYIGVEPITGNLNVHKAGVSISGYDPAIFTLTVARLSAIDGNDGIFSFGLECIVSANDAAHSCNGVDIDVNKISYRLVKGGTGSGEIDQTDTDITFTELENAFSNSGAGISSTDLTNSKWVAQNGTVAGVTLVKGGLKIISAGKTTTTNSTSEDGIIDVTTNGYAFLVVGFDGGIDGVIDSYMYWKINVNATSAP